MFPQRDSSSAGLCPGCVQHRFHRIWSFPWSVDTLRKCFFALQNTLPLSSGGCKYFQSPVSHDAMQTNSRDRKQQRCFCDILFCLLFFPPAVNLLLKRDVLWRSHCCWTEKPTAAPFFPYDTLLLLTLLTKL